ncbi:MAG: dTMP kinase [Bacteroidales bacterium]
MGEKENLFIAFEGIDGSGKSTQLSLLAAQMERSGHKVHCTYEPTDSPIGRMIRNVFNYSVEADNRVIAGLFVADRLDHLLNKTYGIIKKLQEGYTVITDRYYFSSYAYQGVHMSLDWVIEANALSADLLRPDLNIYIDIPPKISMKRLKSGREATELYETEENLRKVREKYKESFERLWDKEKIFITDGDRPANIIASDIWEEVSVMMKDCRE